MRRVLIKPRVRVDLLQIWNYIAADNIVAANGILDQLEQAIRGLAEFPGKGHTRKDVQQKHYRFWSVRPYVIGYHYDASTITIVRVVHGQRNFRKLFARGSRVR